MEGPEKLIGEIMEVAGEREARVGVGLGEMQKQQNTARELWFEAAVNSAVKTLVWVQLMDVSFDWELTCDGRHLFLVATCVLSWAGNQRQLFLQKKIHVDLIHICSYINWLSDGPLTMFHWIKHIKWNKDFLMDIQWW